MKTILAIIFLSLTMILGLSSCNSSSDDNLEVIIPPYQTEKISLTVGSQIFMLSVFDNEIGRAFKALLPLTISMEDMSSNEKFYDLPQSLPTNASNPGTIQNGDFMLYGSRTLVLFYKTFSTSYSYTRIGKVDNPDGLQEALGIGNKIVTFKMI